MPFFLACVRLLLSFLFFIFNITVLIIWSTNHSCLLLTGPTLHKKQCAWACSDWLRGSGAWAGALERDVRSRAGGDGSLAYAPTRNTGGVTSQHAVQSEVLLE